MECSTRLLPLHTVRKTGYIPIAIIEKYAHRHFGVSNRELARVAQDALFNDLQRNAVQKYLNLSGHSPKGLRICTTQTGHFFLR